MDIWGSKEKRFIHRKYLQLLIIKTSAFLALHSPRLPHVTSEVSGKVRLIRTLSERDAAQNVLHGYKRQALSRLSY